MIMIIIIMSVLHVRCSERREVRQYSSLFTPVLFCGTWDRHAALWIQTDCCLMIRLFKKGKKNQGLDPSRAREAGWR